MRALKTGTIIAALIMAMACGFAGCSGGSGGGFTTSGFNAGTGGTFNSSSNTGGRGLGTVTLQIPFAGNTRASSKLQTFPSNIDHVEVELFGPNISTAQIQIASPSSPSVSFSGVPLGESYLLAFATTSSGNFLDPDAPLAQRTLAPGTSKDSSDKPSDSAIHRQVTNSSSFMTLVRLNVHAGDNNIVADTHNLFFGAINFFRRTLNNITGVQVITPNNPSVTQFWTADETGLLDVGRTDINGNQLVLTNQPPSRIVPLPLTDTVDQTFDFQQLIPSPMVLERCRRQVRFIGNENLKTPLGNFQTSHVRTTETCTSATTNQITESFVMDFWVVEGIGPVLFSGAEGSGLFQRRLSSVNAPKPAPVRKQSSSDFVNLPGVALMVERSVGTLSNDVLGNRFGLGQNTQWIFFSTSDNIFL